MFVYWFSSDSSASGFDWQNNDVGYLLVFVCRHCGAVFLDYSEFVDHLVRVHDP